MHRAAYVTVLAAAYLATASSSAFVQPLQVLRPGPGGGSKYAAGRSGPRLRAATMSLFPDGSGVAGAVTLSKGEIKVEFPAILDNADPFVLDTMTIRVPTKIIGRTVEYNAGRLPQDALDRIAALGDEMRANAKVCAIESGAIRGVYNAALAPYLDEGATWSQLPWYLAETYVYHRLLDAIAFFDPASPGYGYDIFATEKEEALQQALPLAAARADACVAASGEWSARCFRGMLHMALWGNQGDSSLFTVADLSGKGGSADASRLLVDDTDDVFDHLSAKGGAVHFFNDNSGMELISDLALVHYLLSTDKIEKVVLHLKPYPFFVSDATKTDLRRTIDVLAASDDPNQKKVAAGLDAHLKDGRLQFTHEGPLNLFLASPDAMWEMPPAERASVRDASLVICKGDLMYRKLLGDRKFDPAEPFQQLLSYFPCPVLALRTCKSPLATGLKDGQAGALDASHPTWKVDGEFGMIQFAVPPPASEVEVSEEGFSVTFDDAAVDALFEALAK
mmetsp:Transcript_21821/g.52485  ORF Transcript_21821/g.52485 Transcript_21821/m.52485 type:complete len:507 (-) Transcript_21821:20-1540(-)